MEETPEKQSDNYYIICPFCKGKRVSDVEDYRDDGYHFKEDCRFCDKKFEVTVSVDTVWSTLPIEKKRE